MIKFEWDTVKESKNLVSLSRKHHLCFMMILQYNFIIMDMQS